MDQKEKLKEIVRAHQQERARFIRLSEQGARDKDIEDSLERLSTLEHAGVRHGAVEGWPREWYGDE